MIDLQYIGVLWGTALNKISKLNWKRLIPKFKVERYPLNNPKKQEFGWAHVLGLEFTQKVGLGVGVGLGLVDIWFGWLRHQESLHTEGCQH